MNSQKLLRRALASPQSLRFAEALKLAEAFGFHLDRINGSHHIFKRAGIPELVN
jgi:predicted RNA binding protein YcfA (HicA-like mRNA interferase family)